MPLRSGGCLASSDPSAPGVGSGVWDSRLPYNRPMPEADKTKTKKKMDKARFRAVLKDAGEIIWRSRLRLAIGIPLLLANRLSSIVLPYLSKVLYDNVLAKGHIELLPKLAL